MEKEQELRRSFLKHVLAGATVLAGVCITARLSKANSVRPTKAKEGDLYRETPEFSKYYKSLRS